MSILESEIQEQGAVNMRQKGIMHRGKIFKGSIQDAGSKCSIGSIPSTFEGIIYRSNTVQAFGSSCHRFESFEKSNISPGMYVKPASLEKTSFNKKGGGALLSKVQRKIHNLKQIPGPGKYASEMTTATTINSTTQFHRRRKSASKSTKQKKIIPRFENDENTIPGPGSYDVEMIKSIPGCQSSFKSELARNNYYLKNANPGPGQYKIQLSKTPVKKNPPKQQLINYDDILQKHLNNADELPLSKGSTIPDFVPKYFKIKNSPGFMQNGRDRFGNGIKQYDIESKFVGNNDPGPGAYDIKSVFNGDRQYMSTSPFLTTGAQQVFKGIDWTYGPNQKQVYLQGKKQFNINLERKWI